MARVSNKFIKPGVDATKIADGSVSNTEFQHIGGLTSDAQTQLDSKIPSSEKGANSGVATLDAGGKIPAAQLPNSVMEYKGTHDVATNTPTLTDGTGNAGDVYRVSVAGSQDYGSGSITLAVGDLLIYSGTIWEKSPGTDAVLSVNGQTGIVSLDTDDIAEGSALYHTDNRARTAAVVNSTAGSETDQAASVAAMKSYVTSQIATKDEASEISYSNTTSGLTATDVQAAIDEVEARVDINDAKVSADGSVTSHSDVTDAGSGAIITSAERSKLAGVEANAKDDQDADEVPYTNTTSGLTATDVQAAIDEIEARVDTNDAKVSADGSVTSHSDVTDAGSGAIITSAERSKLSGIEAGAKDDQSAAEVPYTNTTSGMTATDVQAAIDEVEGRVDTLEGATAPSSASEAITLIAGNITSESVSLANTPRDGAVTLSVDGVVQVPGVDYSVSGSTLRFGDAADAGLTSSDLDPTSGAAALVVGDVLVVTYQH